MGISVFGAIFASLLADKLGSFLPPGALDGAGLNPDSLSASPAQLQALPPDILAPVTRALSESITAVFSYSVPVLVVWFVLALILPGLPLRDTIHLSGSLEGAEIAAAELADADIEGLEPAPVRPGTGPVSQFRPAEPSPMRHVGSADPPTS
jgi:hypothetical protein